ncbi:hypothetical protein B0J13DRAFT_442571 [Dactylonectria estremocensis]|uniref:Zn(2)-C6 fungal-type domain-containing protein n=1 Tax=Dactylonectria estremocensis TaxID=1079267 RepID=A0A9P9EUV2_9HYPO|nr:hypothetical protein B0J13DRAFT_442571 [Dactylonectria estremocensis]
MSETVIRKACDRCHAQKLSCKRFNDKACERCLRLNTECKSSPSLRYRKQQQQQQQQRQQSQQNQQQQQQHTQHHQQLPVFETASSGCRSPKRRRTDSDPSLVSPDTALLAPFVDLPVVAEAVPVSHPAVTPEAALELADFSFTLDQLGLFTAGEPEYLSHAELPSTPLPLHPPLVPPPTCAFTASPWDTQPATLGGTSCTPAHDSPDKRLRRRTKHRPRQIQLSDRDQAAPLLREPPSIHWMAQLSDINTLLLDLSSALPSPQETAQNGPALDRPTDDRFKGSGFPIDDMFQLTRQVADILEQSSSKPFEPIDSSDPGNSMFILSTYTRLLDMYQKVFALVQSELSQAGSDATFLFWKLPDVTVGSFAVESSTFLQMSLTIQVAEEFLSRLRNSTARWSGSGVGTASVFASVVTISFQAFREQEAALAKHLVELRCEIEASLDA